MNQTPALPYKSFGFTITEETNVRSSKCKGCRQSMPKGTGRYYSTISPLACGFMCPACVENEIRIDEIRPARSALLSQISKFVRQADPVLGWESSDRISDVVYSAGVNGVEVATWFLHELTNAPRISYSIVTEMIRTYKASQQAPAALCPAG